MGKIIDVRNINKSIEEKADILQDGQNVICECQNEKIRIAVIQTANGIYYAVMLSMTDASNATFRRTTDKDKALTVFNELKEHIEASDRTYQELCGILNSRL